MKPDNSIKNNWINHVRIAQVDCTWVDMELVRHGSMQIIMKTILDYRVLTPSRECLYIFAAPQSYGPLARYVKLRIAHVPGMPGTFSPPPTSNKTAS